MMNWDDLIDVSNRLTNENLRDLILMTSNRIDVFVGAIDRCQITSEVDSCYLNGAVVQINLKLTQLEDIRDNDFIKYALGDKQ